MINRRDLGTAVYPELADANMAGLAGYWLHNVDARAVLFRPMVKLPDALAKG